MLKFLDYLCGIVLAFIVLILTYGITVAGAKQFSMALWNRAEPTGIVEGTLVYGGSLVAVVLCGFALWLMSLGVRKFYDSSTATKMADFIDATLEGVARAIKWIIIAALIAALVGTGAYFLLGGLLALPINVLLVILILVIIFKK